jgi:hypothetical protein
MRVFGAAALRKGTIVVTRRDGFKPTVKLAVGAMHARGRLMERGHKSAAVKGGKVRMQGSWMVV